MTEKTALQLAYSMGYEDKMAGRMHDSSKAESLGRGECEWVLEHSGTLYDKWRCSKCGFLFVEPRCDQGYTDLEPNYCPNCGAKVVEEWVKISGSKLSNRFSNIRAQKTMS